MKTVQIRTSVAIRARASKKLDVGWRAVVVAMLLSIGAMIGRATPAAAQQPDTRTGLIEQAQAEKAATVHPYEPNAAERYIAYAERYLSGGTVRFHPFFQSPYSGGGFVVGAGFTQHTSAYTTLDVRGSVTLQGYSRIESEFVAPRLFKRRARLSLLGGWREATKVGFYGIGNDTPKVRSNYAFRQPHGSAMLDWTSIPFLVLQGGVEVTQWEQRAGEGSYPPVEDVYTPSTLPGLGADPVYVHTRGTVGIDTRPSPGYARRGGFYGVTYHDYADQDHAFGFRQVDYEAIQHVPILREAWVLSFRAAVQTAEAKDDEEVPFFMLPSLGGGSGLRGVTSWRYRDLNTLVLMAEWRIMVNRFLDTAVFFDAGKVAAHRNDINFDDLKSDFGFGIRFHGPISTPIRIDLAKGDEGLHLIFSASAAF